MTTLSSTPRSAAETPAAQTTPTRRNRRAKEYPPTPNATVPYAKGRPELSQMDDGELMLAIVATPEWEEIVRPVCEELDRTRPTRGPKGLYTSEELETALVYQLFSGLRCYREARDRLAGDRGRAVREALGFDRPRSLSGRRVVALKSGVPSEPTISRHLSHFDPELRCAMYRRLFERLVRSHFEFPEFQEDVRVLYMDGTEIVTHFTAPVYRRQTKEEKRRAGTEVSKTLSEICTIDWSRVVNPESQKITCRDGGYVPYNPTTGKGGHGFNLVSIPTANGLPLEFAVVPINASEKRVGEAILRERFAENVLPLLDRAKLHVLTADGAFTSPTLRAQLRSLGILENLHMVSHGIDSQGRAETFRREVIPIEGYPNWHANGLREISCACGHRATSRVGVTDRGQAYARAEGRCTTCGSITITSGQWRLAQNPKKFRLAHPSDPIKDRDWTFGNPLTYDSPLAAEFGRARFGQNEGFHGALERRFRLIKGKRWYRSRVEAETDTAVIFCVMHALAMEQRRRATATAAIDDQLAA